MVLFAPDGINPIQSQVVHRWLMPCPRCGQNHPSRVCVLATWPPTPHMHRPVVPCPAERPG